MAVPYFDAHCDTAWYIYKFGEKLDKNNGHIDLERLGRLRPAKQFFALYADDDYKDDFPALYSGMLEKFKSELSENPESIALCRTAKEGDEAVKQGKTAAFLSVEGGELISCDIGKLERSYAEGELLISPVWNFDNAWCGGSMDSGSGLTAAGKSALKKAIELGMIVDVSHMSEQGFWDLCRMTDVPFAATHSNSYAVKNHPRNLKDEQFREIAERGGVAGLNLYTSFLADETLGAAARSIEHFMDVGGENSLCLGCDFDGCESLPEGISGIQDMEKLYGFLAERGYSSKLLRKLFHDNLNGMVEKICDI